MRIQRKDAKTRRVVKALGGVFCVAAVLSVVVNFCGLANANEPPESKSLAERVRLASHIFVGVAEDLRVVDAKGKKVVPEPNVLGQRQSTEINVKVIEVLLPRNWPPTNNVKYIFGGGLFSVKDLRRDLIGKELIYLTVQSGPAFKTSYGWHVTDSLESKDEIKKIIKAQSESPRQKE